MLSYDKCSKRGTCLSPRSNLTSRRTRIGWPNRGSSKRHFSNRVSILLKRICRGWPRILSVSLISWHPGKPRSRNWAENDLVSPHSSQSTTKRKTNGVDRLSNLRTISMSSWRAFGRDSISNWEIWLITINLRLIYWSKLFVKSNISLI